MNKTKIEWVKNPDGSQGITLNSKTGCLNHTPEGLCLGGLFPCYAWKLAQGRLRKRYLANKKGISTINIQGMFDDTIEAEVIRRKKTPFYPRFWLERLEQIRRMKKPTGIFLDDMSDWMGDCWPERWTRQELQVMRDCPQHRFYTLTKQGRNLINWSPFPDNCYVGVTATDTSMAWIASKQLSQIEAGVKFLSIEPLLSWETSTPYTTENIVAGLNGSLGWLIIGACTGTLEDIKKANYEHQDTSGLMPMPWGKHWTLQPRIEWIKEIVDAADKAGIPVFLKDNLKPLLQLLMRVPNMSWFGNVFGLRQEMPKVK